ncbi:RNA 2',3'-cyclic phosphodiesterase [Planotetraspora thailandica]|uniref:RNA 2',3'-cyclic phosphodiesterase n=1 Tax=Planotetraspora thailandica TaxID=487172 RepID=A0A8J3Y0C2_9ACTN|nr:RNA 2',3'-cyclic phosphodiesterase [Planotetraspora thailandica]
MALLPPPEALSEIAVAVDRVRAGQEGAAGPPGLRWIDRALWHVTLAFLGEVPDRVLPGLHVRLARAASRHPSLTLSFAGSGAFPSPGRGRVLWVGLPSGPPLKKLADSVAAGARRAGAVEKDRMRFHPHLTLARAREGADLWPLVHALSGFNGRPWEAKAIHLMRSHLGPHVRYEPVEAYSLGGRD